MGDEGDKSENWIRLFERLGAMEKEQAAVMERFERLEKFTMTIAARAKDAVAGRGRCVACQGFYYAKREPYPGGLCWQCWSWQENYKRAAHGGSP